MTAGSSVAVDHEPSDGAPSPPPGRARKFRDRRQQKRAARREHLGEVLVVIVIVLGVVAIVTAQPYTPGGSSVFPKPGPLITVTLGNPNASTVTCGAGGTAYLERMTFVASTVPITTGDVNLRLYEIWDGDNIADLGVVANVTASSLCAGSPPNFSPGVIQWYVVLSSSNGTILLSYTVASTWTSVSGGNWNFVIPSGATLTIVTGGSIAGTGRGLAVVGFSKGSPIHGSIPL